MKIETEKFVFVSLFNEDFLELNKNLSIIKTSEKTENTRIYFDTFDHRLEKESLYLELYDNTFYLKQIVDNSIIASCNGYFSHKMFLKDFEDKQFVEKISEIIMGRALIPKFKYKISHQNFEIKFNDSEQIIKLSNYKAKDAEDNFVIDYNEFEVNPEIEKIALACGYEKASYYLYDYLEINSQEYKGKNWDLVKIQRVESCKNVHYNVYRLLRSLRQFIALLIDDIIQDTDTEFIHNYRVYIRQVRSFIHYTQNFYPKEASKVDELLKFLFQKTNHLRDLDVFLIKKDYIFSNLDESTFKQLYIHLLIDREIEFANVVAFFKSNEFSKKIKELKTFEKKFKELSYLNKKKFDSKKLKKIFFEKYLEFFKYNNEELSKASIKDIHKLRIRIKELRYNILLFSNFGDEKDVKEIIVILKKYQDYLGELTDLNLWILFWNEKIDFVGKKKEINLIINLLKEKCEIQRKNLIENHRTVIAELSKIFI